MKLIAVLSLVLTLAGCAAEPLVWHVHLRADAPATFEEVDRVVVEATAVLGYIPLTQVAAPDYRARCVAMGDARFADVEPGERAEAVWAHVYRDGRGALWLALDLLVRDDFEAGQRIEDELVAELQLRAPWLSDASGSATGLGYDPRQPYAVLDLTGGAK